LAEKLFSRLKQVTSNNSFRFEVRLLFISFISRLIGVHRLILLNFYDYLIPYLKPHQKEVTSILAFAAQASHELVPPDALETVVQAIADNFVWSNCATEVITAGLNGLREICVRSPLAMPEQLLQSLIDDYKNYREKGPMNAARSLLGLYREVNPEMLKKKDRGKAATINITSFKAPQYGHVDIATGIEGADVSLFIFLFRVQLAYPDFYSYCTLILTKKKMTKKCLFSLLMNSKLTKTLRKMNLLMTKRETKSTSKTLI
jgi:protein SDA1